MLSISTHTFSLYFTITHGPNVEPCFILQIHKQRDMQAQELLKQLRVPELAEMRDYFLRLSTGTLVGIGTFAALATYWYTTRPKALKPPCDLRMQSVEVPVSACYGLESNSLRSQSLDFCFFGSVLIHMNFMLLFREESLPAGQH